MGKKMIGCFCDGLLDLVQEMLLGYLIYWDLCLSFDYYSLLKIKVNCRDGGVMQIISVRRNVNSFVLSNCN